MVSSFFPIEEYPFFNVEVMNLTVENIEKKDVVFQNWELTPVAKEFKCILNQLQKIENNKKIDSFDWSEFFNIIRDDIYSIRDYTLRIIQVPINQEFKNKLFKMEEKFHTLESSIKTLGAINKTGEDSKNFLEKFKGNSQESEMERAKFVYKETKKLKEKSNKLIFKVVESIVESSRDLYKIIWEYENLVYLGSGLL